MRFQEDALEISDEVFATGATQLLERRPRVSRHEDESEVVILRVSIFEVHTLADTLADW